MSPSCSGVVTVRVYNFDPRAEKLKSEEIAVQITVEGHSGKGRKGNDVACAGISAIAQTAVVGISRVAGLRQRITQREGYLDSVVETSGDRGKTEALRVIIATMVAGLTELEKTYPGSMQMKFD
jgi:hypothetical protein